MEFNTNTRYGRPPDKPASWFYDVLREVSATRVGDIAIEIEMLGGGTAKGMLNGVGDVPLGMHGAVTLTDGLAIPVRTFRRSRCFAGNRR